LNRDSGFEPEPEPESVPARARGPQPGSGKGHGLGLVPRTRGGGPRALAGPDRRAARPPALGLRGFEFGDRCPKRNDPLPSAV